MREAIRILVFTMASLALLLSYLGMAAPETPAITYGWVVAGYAWGAGTVLCYLLTATRQVLDRKRRLTIDQMADQVVEIEVRGEHTPLH